MYPQQNSPVPPVDPQQPTTGPAPEPTQPLPARPVAQPATPAFSPAPNPMPNTTPAPGPLTFNPASEPASVLDAPSQPTQISDPTAAFTPPQFNQQQAAAPIAPPQPQPTQPHHSNKKALAIVGIIIAVVLLAIAGAVAYVYMNYQSAIQQSNTNTADQTADTTDYTGKDIAFGFTDPAPTGWQNDIFNKDGIFRYKHAASGCQITFKQSLGATDATSQGLTAEDTEQTYLDSTKALGVGNFKQATTTDTFSLKTNQGQTVKFTPAMATYVGDGDIAYTIQVGAEWLGNTELLIVPACPTDQWQTMQTAVGEFIDEVQIIVT